MFTFDEIFNCGRCGHWYPLDQKGLAQNCKSCSRGLPIRTEAIIPEEIVSAMILEAIPGIATTE